MINTHSALFGSLAFYEEFFFWRSIEIATFPKRPFLIDQAKIELITTFLGRNCRMDFMKGACLQIEKSVIIM